MKAGRDLDMLISKHVFGMDLPVVFSCVGPLHEALKEHEPFEICPWYSTSIDAAWIVVEKFRSVGFEVDVTARPDLQYGCRIAPKGEWNTCRVSFRSADTAPLAICLAALASMGEKSTTPKTPNTKEEV